jgi:hypothetical protein
MRDRRDRQVRAMHDSVRKAGGDRDKVWSESQFYFKQLEDVVMRSHAQGFEFEQAGDALVLGALQIGKGSLGSHIVSGAPKNIHRLVADAPAAARKIIKEGLEGNALVLGTLGSPDKNLMIGPEQLPMMLWPINSEALRKIVFSEVMVLTMYNPAHLWERIRAKGFDVELDERGWFKRGLKEDGGRQIELVNMNYFAKLVAHSLVTEESVIGMIDQTLATAAMRAESGRVKIEMIPRLGLRRWS